MADVLALRGRPGWLSPPLRPLAGGPPAAGPAVTVQLGEGGGGFAPLYDLLSGDLTGAVVVVAAPRDDLAVWGELLTMAAAGRGARAVVVAGAARDRQTCPAFGIPIWCANEATVGPSGRLEVTAVGCPVTVAGVVIDQGDTVVVDDDGVVALPAAEADELLVAADAYARAEAEVAAALAAGRPLRDAYRAKADTVARLRAQPG